MLTTSNEDTVKDHFVIPTPICNKVALLHKKIVAIYDNLNKIVNSNEAERNLIFVEVFYNSKHEKASNIKACYFKKVPNSDIIKKFCGSKSQFLEKSY